MPPPAIDEIVRDVPRDGDGQPAGTLASIARRGIQGIIIALFAWLAMSWWQGHLITIFGSNQSQAQTQLATSSPPKETRKESPVNPVASHSDASAGDDHTSVDVSHKGMVSDVICETCPTMWCMHINHCWHEWAPW